MFDNIAHCDWCQTITLTHAHTHTHIHIHTHTCIHMYMALVTRHTTDKYTERKQESIC